jgi:hypothetical protein
MHPEAKSLGPDGEVGVRSTAGLLSRRAVNIATIRHIGKEANRLEDVDAGVVGELGDVVTEYLDPRKDVIRTIVLPVLLEEFSEREIARRIGVDHKTIAGIERGSRPRSSNAEKLLRLALERAEARQRMGSASPALLVLLAEVAANEVLPARL